MMMRQAIKNLNVTLEWSVSNSATSTSQIQWITSGSRPTDSQIQAEYDRLVAEAPMTELRRERNIRLAACDWRAFADSPTMSDAWKTYRQSLRDLPASSSPTLDLDGNLDMSSVTFPTEPS